MLKTDSNNICPFEIMKFCRTEQCLQRPKMSPSQILKEQQQQQQQHLQNNLLKGNWRKHEIKCEEKFISGHMIFDKVFSSFHKKK